MRKFLRTWFIPEYRRMYWNRLSSRTIMWLCNLTGGHVWSGLLVQEAPRRGDFVEYVVAAQCMRCRYMMYNRGAITMKTLAQARDPKMTEFFKERLVREMLAATAGRAAPVFDSFGDWMYDMNIRRRHA